MVSGLPDHLMNAAPDSPAHANLRVDRNIKTLRELALDKLREGIWSGHFKMGQRLVERDLCAQLDVSRTVIREALRHLESEGLVETIPHQGPAVATVNADQARQIYEIRAMLEGRAARRCAELATAAETQTLARLNEQIQGAFAAGRHREVIVRTTAFYDALFQIAGLEIAGQVTNSLNARINQLRALTIGSPGRKSDAGTEMCKILEAIESRDPEAAERAAWDHIASVARIAAGVFERVNGR